MNLNCNNDMGIHSTFLFWISYGVCQYCATIKIWTQSMLLISLLCLKAEGSHKTVLTIHSLTRCSLVMPFVDTKLLAQVMACCLVVPSHYLNQCSLIISEVLWHSPEGNFREMLKIYIHDLSLKITNIKSQPHLSGANEIPYQFLLSGQLLMSCLASMPFYLV